MICHDVDYRIIGHDLQVIEVDLDHGETVIAEAGARSYLEDGSISKPKWVTAPIKGLFQTS